MRFLLDQDVYALTARFLIEVGHDVLTAAELGLSRSPDVELLTVAEREGRILVTRDRHFGSIVFLESRGAGVIYLRVTPQNLADVHGELARVLGAHSQEELAAAFVTIEPGRHRLRHIPPA